MYRHSQRRLIDIDECARLKTTTVEYLTEVIFITADKIDDFFTLYSFIIATIFRETKCVLSTNRGMTSLKNNNCRFIETINNYLRLIEGTDASMEL